MNGIFTFFPITLRSWRLVGSDAVNGNESSWGRFEVDSPTPSFQRNSVAHLQLEQPLVAQRDSLNLNKTSHDQSLHHYHAPAH
jgi:hypothetical protein